MHIGRILNNLSAYEANADEIEAAILPTDTAIEIKKLKGTRFPRLPDHIQKVSFSSYNHVNSLQTMILPRNLKELLIWNCDSLFLPTLPEGLQRLSIVDTHFKTLPKLPESLTDIRFGLMYNFNLWDPSVNDTSIDALTPEEPIFTFIKELWAENGTNIGEAWFADPSPESVEHFKRKVNDYLDYKEELRREYGAILSYKRGLVVRPVNRANKNSSSEMTLGSSAKQTFMNVGLPDEISSYLTGIDKKTVNQQKANLRRRIMTYNRNNFTKFQQKRGHGGKRNTRRRKTRKN